MEKLIIILLTFAFTSTLCVGVICIKRDIESNQAIKCKDSINDYEYTDKAGDIRMPENKIICDTLYVKTIIKYKQK